MEKLSNNIKFCTFISILIKYSSEEVSISIKEINHYMKKRLGVTLDRRTMYSYIRDMRHIGLEVSTYDKEKEGYFLKDFFLQENEFKLLMDSVKASKFITQKKTEELIEKISKLNFIFRGRMVKSNVLIDDISKNMNEEIYDKLNLMDDAITQKKKIIFTYCCNNNNKGGDKKEKGNNDGERFIVNPICVTNNREAYYLMCTDNKYEKIIYYEMDYIKDLEVLDEEIEDLKFIEMHTHGFDA